MKLTADEVDALGYQGLAGFEVLENKIVDQGRWTTYHQIIFRKDGELWGFTYGTGSTEYQDVDQPSEVECYPVEAYQTVAYRVVGF